MTIWNTFAWMVAGPIYIVFFILRDTQYLFRIFLMHKGCRAANNIKDELATEQFPIMDEVNCFNEARHIVLEKYREHIKKAREASMKDEAQKEDDEEDEGIKEGEILIHIANDYELIEAHREE